MKNILKIVSILFFAVFVGLQFIRPEKTNPPIIESESLGFSTNVPKDISGILMRSCKDCHSNATVYPFYSNISPISWSVVDHIKLGREKLNFSKWNTYSKRKKLRKLEQICEEVVSKRMPHNQYLWIHWDAALSDLDRQSLCDWTKAETVKINDGE